MNDETFSKWRRVGGRRWRRWLLSVFVDSKTSARRPGSALPGAVEDGAYFVDELDGIMDRGKSKMGVDRILSKLRDSAGGIRVRSALNPLLWLVAPLMVGFIAAMYFSERLYQIDYEWIITGTFGLLTFAVITALGVTSISC